MEVKTLIQKPLDRVNEAYKGELGEDFSKKTRNRINWIVNQVKGNEILDIGCSQGIISIILGREGKKVDAIDILEESIEYAKNELKNEHLSVQENVNFRVANFMTDEDFKNGYETILLTEVLEHISDTDMFLKKIYDLLLENGILVITVPFGINDYFDHKRTYYYLDLHDQVSKYFNIEKIHYLGKWVGIVCKKDKINYNKKDMFSRDEIAKLENAFYSIEREYVEKIENYLKQISLKNENIKNLSNKIKTLELKEIEIIKLEGIIKEKENIIEELKKENLTLKSNLEESLDNEEKVLKTNLKQSDEIQKLNSKINILQRNYEMLRHSKLGKITLKYWNLRRKLKSKGR
jgi:2-polyprenyl-3-methyl-5-hydroxy-6-metoxy-1,4-benzoquinol methylase